ncbi:MAG TPA: sigma-70 family RNA polymerase sigma factor [Candidatus Treponema faecavium]|nr:sigma-70 family RNA polymerase sigma factor [Candidatus Treponema faecavium]
MRLPRFLKRQHSTEHAATAAAESDSRHHEELTVRLAQKGDSQAFAELVRLFSGRVVAMGRSFFKNDSDIEDFIQDVFLKAYAHLASFRGSAAFSTWLTRIAYTTAVNAVNRRKEYEPLSDDMLPPDTRILPEEQQMRKLTILAVREAIAELPKRYAVCLDMYFFYDLSYSDISEITQLPINTVKSHIFRAKKILRDKLAELHSLS